MTRQTTHEALYSHFRKEALTHSDYILSEVRNNKGIITLNRPRALNALHPYMMCKLRVILGQWQENPDVHAVILRSNSERAFSAGGDLRAVYESIRDQQFDLLRFLFQEEYALDHLVKTYTKPYISFIDGIVMGGGMGISINGNYRIMSDRIVAAMPETKIAFFPDAGATHFLNQAPGRIGMYLALTGNTCDLNDAVTARFATHIATSDTQKNLFEEVISLNTKSADHAQQLISEHLSPYQSTDSSQESFLSKHRCDIDQHFSRPSLEDIISSLESAAKTPRDEFARETLETLRKRSPTSLHITHRQMKLGENFSSFQDAVELEYKLSQHVIHHHDFPEGMRAVIIDKDQSPRWSPTSIHDVPQSLIDAHFLDLDHKLFATSDKS